MNVKHLTRFVVILLIPATSVPLNILTLVFALPSMLCHPIAYVQQTSQQPPQNPMLHRVSTVDMLTIVTPRDYADTFHPRAGGCDKVARAWERAIRLVFPISAPRNATQVPFGASRTRGT